MRISEIILGASFIILIAGLSYGFHNRQSWEGGPVDVQPTPGFPEEIMTIVINSCYDCHSGETQNKLAKAALDYSVWNEYKTAKKIQLLNKIRVVIKEGDMPPGRFLTNNPGKKLTEEQVNTISKWTEEEAKRLVE